jgi:hypothetical protein
MVGPARKAADQMDLWSHFYGFGTCRMPDEYTRPGRLNDKLGLSASHPAK